MHYVHSHVITFRPPARTGAWSLAALARRIPEGVHEARELRAGFEGLELWIRELAEHESEQAFEALAHSPTLRNWHRDNARKVVQQALMRDLRAFQAVHLGAELASAVLPRCDAAQDDAAVRVRHVRELAALLSAARAAMDAQGLSGEAALRGALQLRGQGEPATPCACRPLPVPQDDYVPRTPFVRAGRGALQSASA